MTNVMEFDENEPTVVPVVIASETADATRIDVDSATETEISSVMSQELLERLLAMAQRYRKEGSDRQATEMFWSLVEEHSETPQANAAKAELLALAEGYERAGNQYMARSMYERLLDLED